MLNIRPALGTERDGADAAVHNHRADEYESNARIARGAAEAFNHMTEVLKAGAVVAGVARVAFPNPLIKGAATAAAAGLAAGALASAEASKSAKAKAEAEAAKAEAERKAAAEANARAAAEAKSAMETAQQAREWQSWRDRESKMSDRDKKERTERIIEGERRSRTC